MMKVWLKRELGIAGQRNVTAYTDATHRATIHSRRAYRTDKTVYEKENGKITDKEAES